MKQPLRHERSITIFFTSIVFLLILFFSLVAFMWGLVASDTISSDTSFWFMLALLSGIMTIFLPCTLPLAFVTVPVAREKFMLRSLGMILLFALGVSAALTLYGTAFGALGLFWIGLFPKEALHSIIPWVYVLAGLYAYALSLGELGLLPLRMPSYAGKGPEFITKTKGVSKMFFMGLFLGNVGVGCPFPAIPLLLISAVLSGSPVYGALLFLMHAIGRVIPLLVLLSLATANVDGLAWLTKNKERFDRASGWVFIFCTSFLITVGAYAHQWYYSTELYRAALGVFTSVFPGVIVHGIAPAAGVFKGAIPGANVVFLALLLVPLWWIYFKERRRIYGSPVHQIQKIERDIGHLLLEMRGHEAALHIREGGQHERVRALDRHIDTLLAKRRILEEGMRYGGSRLENKELLMVEEESLYMRRNWYITLTALSIIVVYAVLS